MTPEFFRNVGSFEKVAPYLKKVQIADAWGNIACLIRGKPPKWAVDSKVPEMKQCDQYNESRFTGLTLEEAVSRFQKLTKYTPVSRMVIKQAFMVNQKIADLYEIASSKRGIPVMVRKIFLDTAAKELKAQIEYQMGTDHTSPILGFVAGRVSVAIMPVIMNGECEVLTPIEGARRIYASKHKGR